MHMLAIEGDWVRLRLRLCAGMDEGEIWKPMHMQPIYRINPFITQEDGTDVGSDGLSKGMFSPSKNRLAA